MEKLIQQYLKDHLSINIKEESYGFNGKCVVFELKIDNEIISSDTYSLKGDEG